MKRCLLLPVALLVALLTSLGCGSGSVDTADAPADLSFANAKRLHEHWLKHGREFEPGVTEEQYLAKARTFFNDRSTEKLLKHRDNGDELHYLPKTNEFGVLSEEDVIRTYFRPSSGRSYWERQ